jgi:nucleoside-diphosphate-sugar epimerase
LGSALHKYLSKQSEFVSGCYNLSSKGLANEFKYTYPNAELPEQITQANVIIFNLTPSVILDIETFKNFISNFKNKKLIFISSTSVYGQTGTVDESTIPTPQTKNGILLKSCEDYVQATVDKFCIIRPAGLYDNLRHPGNSLSGRSDVKGRKKSVNLISKKDLVKIIMNANNLEKNIIVNAVNTNHPEKEAYYNLYCKKNNLDLITFDKERCSMSKTVETKYNDFKVSSELP